MEVSSNQWRASLFGLGAVLLWSTVATGFKLGLEIMTTTQLLMLGTWISWMVFALAAMTSGDLNITRGDRLRVLALGSITPCLYYWILFAAYDRLPAHVAQPLNYTWAVTLAILAIPLLGHLQG